nr:peptidase E [uncultured Niameybacter sp.]
MGKIVAIGGGELRMGETYLLDKYIVELASTDNPNLLFIPTASRDAEGYIEIMQEYFGKLGCNVESLCLITKQYTDEEIRNSILNADIIYVGGGDTLRMIEKWKAYKVDLYLKEAYEKGIVLSGISAGSICWFEFGHSDSDFFINKDEWKYIKVQGLGFIQAGHCPHYNEEGREGFDQMMVGQAMLGIALEDQTAFVEVDGKYSILKANNERKAYLFKNSNGVLEKQELAEGWATLKFK